MALRTDPSSQAPLRKCQRHPELPPLRHEELPPPLASWSRLKVGSAGDGPPVAPPPCVWDLERLGAMLAGLIEEHDRVRALD
jgi:hypothetical protein